MKDGEPQRRWNYGLATPGDLEGRSGLEFLTDILDGTLPAPPIGETLDFEPAGISEGRAVFHGVPGKRHYNPLGGVHGGWIATLLDSCMGCAVQTLLRAGEGFTTLELKVNFLRGLTEATGSVEAVGTAIHRGRRTALAEGKLLDEQGRLLAHGTTTCLIYDFAARSVVVPVP